jgi:hypothetical protein
MIRAFTVFLIVLFACEAKADIAFVTAADLGNNNGSSNNFSTSFNAMGANLLILMVLGDAPVAHGGGGLDDVVSVTYAGVPATFVTKNVDPTNSNRFSYFYYIIHPTTGSNNVVATFTNVHWIAVLASDYSGAGSSGTIPGASISSIDTGNNASYTSALSTAPDRAWVMLEVVGGVGATPACSAGATARVDDAAFLYTEICDSAGPVTPPQSYSMTATTGTVGGPGPFQTHLMASFGPDAGGLMMRGCCQ